MQSNEVLPSRRHGKQVSSASPHAELSENETALWLDCIKRPSFPGHVLPVYFHFEPDPSLAALQSALDRLVAQFPRLAMTVVEKNGLPEFTACESPKIKLHDLDRLPDQEYLMRLAFAPMPLDAPLMQWHRFQIGGDAAHTRHLLRCHHLLGDQQSVIGLWQALAQFLNNDPPLARANQAQLGFQRGGLQLSDPICHVRWQAAQARPALAPEFDAEPSGLALSVFESLTIAQSQAIQRSAKAAQLSTFELLLAAYADSLDEVYGAHARTLHLPALSQKKTGQYDVCTLALQLTPIECAANNRPASTLRARDLATQVRARVVNPPLASAQALRHGIVYSRAPLGACASFSGLSSNVEGHRISLVQQNSSPLNIILHRLPAQPAAFASCAQIYQWDDRLHLSVQLDRALFSAATAALILQSWRKQIERWLGATPSPLCDLVMTGAPQSQVNTSPAGSISALLAQAAAQYADCTALDDGLRKLSYQDLERFYSCDSGFPEALDPAPSINQAVQCYVALRRQTVLDFRITKLPLSTALSENCAVIFASSGTTGAPANITLSSANLAAYATAMVAALALKPGDRVLRFAGSAFDAVLEELLVSFLSGATLVCPVDANSREAVEARFESFPALSLRIEALAITALNVSTSWWHAAQVDHMIMPGCIRQIVIGGEAASAALWRQFSTQYPAIDLVNTYGLTEACVSQCISRGAFDARHKFVPLGASLSHVDAVIFQCDSELRAGLLEPGELCLSGASLGETSRADRYFVLGDQRYLRTGDHVVCDASGILHYLGRLNRIVKQLGKWLDLDTLALDATTVQANSGAESGAASSQICTLIMHGADAKQSQIVLLHEQAPSAALQAFATRHHAALFYLKRIPRTAGGKPDYPQMQAAILQAKSAADQAFNDTTAQKPAVSGALDVLIRATVGAHFDDSTRLSSILSSLDWLRLRGAIELQFGVQLQHSDHDHSIAKIKQLLRPSTAPVLKPAAIMPNHTFDLPVLPRQSSSLCSGFLHAATEFPDAIALISGGQALSYSTLLAQTQALVKIMQQAGVASGARVAFTATRAIFDVLAMLAISAAGAAFVPLAMTLKKAELSQRIAQVGANFWLHEGKLQPLLEAINQAGYPAIPDLAYILLTSGSSGVPKAVAMTHAGANNTLNDLIHRLSLGAKDSVLALSPTQFDLSIFDVFATLSVGATLVWPEESQRRDASTWPALVAQHGISIWNSVPSSLNLLLADSGAGDSQLQSLRYVLLSGDFVSKNLIARALQALPNAEIAVLGGATEAGIWSCIFDARQLGVRMFAPYGAALDGQQLSVDAAPGEVGEIVITGTSVGAGYLHDGNLAQRFRDDHGAPCYRTGDLGRALADGCIEILGRQDQQVKWRGLRVSVLDIEAQLLGTEGVLQAAAITLDSSLVAVIVLQKPAQCADTIHPDTIHPDNIIAALKNRLTQSAIAVPDRFEIFDEALPLTANGKLDRIALRQSLLSRKSPVAAPIPMSSCLARQNSVHPSARALWQQFLPGFKPESGDWFSQGGHSLQALKLIEAARASGAAKGTLGGFLRQPTLAHFSSWFEGQTPEISAALAARSNITSRMDRAETDAREIARLRQMREAILITGATGMLAVGLMKELRARSSRPLILCVRSETHALAQQRMLSAISDPKFALNTERILILRFDLAEPALGWSPPLFDAVAGAITEIWHLGAEVNFLLSDSELAASNTHSVEAIFKLAARNGALLHFASSLGIFPYRLVHDVDERSDRPSGLFASGYASSKWHAEQRLCALIAHSNNQVPSKNQAKLVRLRIYRLGLCVSSKPRTQDIVGMSRIALTLCNSWPDSMMPVNALAQADAVSALLLLADIDQNTPQTRIWHVQNEPPESINALHAQIAPSAAKIALSDWLARLALSGQLELNAETALARDLLLLLIPAGTPEPADAGGQVLSRYTLAELKARGWQPQTVASALRHALLG